MTKLVCNLKVGTIFYFKCIDTKLSGFYIKLNDLVGGCECKRIKDNKIVGIAYNASVTVI